MSGSEKVSVIESEGVCVRYVLRGHCAREILIARWSALLCLVPGLLVVVV